MRDARLSRLIIPTLASVPLVGLIILTSCVGDDPAASPVLPATDAAAQDSAAMDGPGVPQTTVYVDPVAGADTNDGRSLPKAVRSLKKALSLAVAGDVVELASGRYGAGNGDDYKVDAPDPNQGYTVPSGITIRNAQPGGATLEGVTASNALHIPVETKGTVKIVNLKLTGFQFAIAARGGTTELSGVQFEDSHRQLEVTGTATVTGASCTFTGGADVGLNADGNAIVKLKNASFKGLKGLGAGSLRALGVYGSSKVEIADSTIESNTGQLADIRGSAILVLFNSVVKNNLLGAIPDFSRLVLAANAGQNNPTLKIDGGQIANNAGGAIFASSGGTIDLTNTDITNNGDVGIDLSGKAFLKGRNTKVRNHALANIRASATSSATSPLDEPQIDFGKKGDSGFNDLTFASAPGPGVFSIEIFTGGSVVAAKTHTFVGTQFTFNTTQPTGTITANNTVTMAPHYNLVGTGFKVVFSDP